MDLLSVIDNLTRYISAFTRIVVKEIKSSTHQLRFSLTFHPFGQKFIPLTPPFTGRDRIDDSSVTLYTNNIPIAPQLYLRFEFDALAIKLNGSSHNLVLILKLMPIVRCFGV